MSDFYKTDIKKTLNNTEYIIYKLKGSNKQYIRYKKEYILLTDFKNNLKKGGMIGKVYKPPTVTKPTSVTKPPSVTKQISKSQIMQHNPELKQGLKAFADSNPKTAAVVRSVINSSLGHKVVNNPTVQKVLNHSGSLNSLTLGPSNISLGKFGNIGTVGTVGNVGTVGTVGNIGTVGIQNPSISMNSSQVIEFLPQIMQTMTTDQIQLLKTIVCSPTYK